jgi:NAD(P) transhydrogenase subunit beta
MAIAVAATLLDQRMGNNWVLIIAAMIVGTVIAVPAARNVKMTAMPQMVALFNGVGGGAVALIAWAEFRELHGDLGADLAVGIPLVFAAIIGSISFWGSNIAFAKLQALISGSPVKIPGGLFVNLALLATAIGAGVAILLGSTSEGLFVLILVAAAILLDFGVSANVTLGQRAIFALGPEYRGRLNGLYMATFFAGGALGSALGGWAYAYGGWLLASSVGVMLPVVALLCFATERR